MSISKIQALCKAMMKSRDLICCELFLIFEAFFAVNGQLCEFKSQSGSQIFSLDHSDVTIECSVNIQASMSSFSWKRQRDDTIIAEEEQINPRLNQRSRYKIQKDTWNYRLEISNITKADEGGYCCEVRYFTNIVSNCSRLHIIQPLIVVRNNWISKSAKDEPVLLTVNNHYCDSIPLTCTLNDTTDKVFISDSGIVSLSWLHKDTVLTTGNATSLNYSFKPSKEHQEAMLTCKANIECRNTSLSEENTVLLIINYKPYVTVRIEPSSSLLEGQDVKLFCDYESHPDPISVVWTKDNEYFSNESSVFIRNISLIQQGLYNCKVNNSVGWGQDKRTISVTELPVMSILQLPNGSLLCNLTEKLNEYRYLPWKHISFLGEHIRTVTGTSEGLLDLQFSNDTLSYFLDGSYGCKIEYSFSNSNNCHESIYLKKFIDVSFNAPPVCLPNTFYDEIQYGVVGSNAVFKKYIYSRKSLRFNWTFRGHVLRNSNNYKVHVREDKTSVSIAGTEVFLECLTITLNIQRLAENDFGLYSLDIENSFGSNKCQIRLLKDEKTTLEMSRVLTYYIVSCIICIVLVLSSTAIYTKLQKKYNVSVPKQLMMSFKTIYDDLTINLL